jgi:alpha-glucosidase
VSGAHASQPCCAAHTTHRLIFEEQYVYVGTSLPANASVYGFGAHNDQLQLPISEANYTRTLWNRDAYGVPSRTNLYGSTAFYLEHRIAEDGNSSSAHGVFLLNSNGMDIKFPEEGRNLEYHILGGILDLHFRKSRPSCASLAR